MSNILSAIDDDIEEYLWLCKRYHEEPQYEKTAQGIPLPDCYGKHSQQLEKRFQHDQGN